MEVVVCGGGIAGLVTALCLHDGGFAVKVLEKKDTRVTTTAAINLSPSGARVLADIGVLEAVQEKSEPVRIMRMLTSDGAVLAELPFKGREQYGHDPLCVTRRALHNALVEAVNRRGIELRHSCGVLGVAQDATGVTVELEDGTAMRCHVLIGADGIHSKVRECIFPDLLVERSSKAYFGCGALMPLSCLSPEEIDELRLTEGSFNMINGPNGFAGFIGIGSPEAAQEPKFMFWTHIAESLVDDSFDFKNMSSVKETLQRLRHGWCRPVATAISLLDQNVPGVEAMCGPIFSLRPIPEWSNGRVVLIGDAAHGYGPGAQGAALAMEDARLLALQLKSCENETEALNRVFRNFETKRRSRVERIGNAAEARNSDRLGVSPWWKTKLREYVMMGLHSWYRNGYFLAEYAYRVEEDL